jgi:hypothetical protein
MTITIPTVQAGQDPRDRIVAAFNSFNSWRAPSELPHMEKQYARGDRQSSALSHLIGYLQGLARNGDVAADEIAEAVEYCLRKADVTTPDGGVRP